MTNNIERENIDKNISISKMKKSPGAPRPMGPRGALGVERFFESSMAPGVCGRRCAKMKPNSS